MKLVTNERGFTLVELVLVIAVISVTITFILIRFNPIEQIEKSNDAKRKGDLKQIQNALEAYYADNGSYPLSSANKIFVNSTALNWGDTWTPYINLIPRDPLSAAGRTYIYYSPPSANGQTYYLYANLERGNKDRQACNSGNACMSLITGGSGFPAQTACGGICSFGLSSPNVSP